MTKSPVVAAAETAALLDSFDRPPMHDHFRFERERLSSYRRWPVAFLSPERMAAAGFYYLNRQDVVRCAFCGVEVGSWVEGDDPMEDHEKWSRHCRFVRKLPVGNVPAGESTDQQSTAYGEDTCGIKESGPTPSVSAPTPQVSSPGDQETKLSSWTVTLKPPGSRAVAEEVATAEKTGNGGGEDNRSDGLRSICKICYNDEVEVVFLPCGHVVACAKCAFPLVTCAVCRRPVDAKTPSTLFDVCRSVAPVERIQLNTTQLPHVHISGVSVIGDTVAISYRRPLWLPTRGRVRPPHRWILLLHGHLALNFPDMLSMTCCHHTCASVIHGTPWDCGRNRSVSGGDAAGTDGEFSRLFENTLPLELKYHCLRFCRFHVLVNPELWLRDFDPFFFRTLMRDEHFRGTKCNTNSWCVKQRMLFFVRDPVRMRVSVRRPATPVFPQQRAVVVGREDLDRRFGRVNRYPAFYYRFCSHFGHDQRPPADGGDQSERWKRLGIPSVWSTPFAKKGKWLFEGAFEMRQAFVKSHRPAWDQRDGRSYLAGVVLEPGCYYWELINYDLERALQAVNGDGNMQTHFLIDPTDPPSRSSGTVNEMHFSLMFRRVANPDHEKDDTFQTLWRFAPGDVEPCVRDLCVKHIYLTLPRTGGVGGEKRQTATLAESEDGGELSPCEDEEEAARRRSECSPSDQQSMRFEPQEVYSHVSSHGMGIRVWRCGDCSEPNNTVAFRVSLADSFRPVSIDTNKTTVRINLTLDLADMTLGQKAVYGMALGNIVTDPWQNFYQFSLPSYPIGITNMRARNAGVKLFECLRSK